MLRRLATWRHLLLFYLSHAVQTAAYRHRGPALYTTSSRSLTCVFAVAGVLPQPAERIEQSLHSRAAMPRASAKPKDTWTTNVAANGLHRAGACAEEFYSLKPGHPLEPHQAQIMHLLEGRARQDNKYKAASRQDRPWEGRKLTAAEKAYIWAKNRGKCNHPYCKEPWIKLHYKTGTKSRFTIGEHPPPQTAVHTDCLSVPCNAHFTCLCPACTSMLLYRGGNVWSSLALMLAKDPLAYMSLYLFSYTCAKHPFVATEHACVCALTHKCCDSVFVI